MKAEKRFSGDLPDIAQLQGELNRVRHRSRYIRVLKSTAGMLLVVAAIAVLAATFWLPVLRVTGNSMSPTLQHGDIVLCVADEEAEPGELVSFYVGNKLLLKRCIAGPGQQVDLNDSGYLLLDGEILDKAPGSWEQEQPCLVPEGKYFCLGDNREISVDSRHLAVGFVGQEQILGKPLLRIWPLHRFGLLG